MPAKSSARRVDAVFFDVDDTLYSTTDFARRARARSIDAMISVGLKGSRQALLNELDEVVAEFTSNYDQHFQKLLERLPPASHAGVNPAVLVAAAVGAYHDAKRDISAFPDVLAVMPALAKAGLLLGVITDGLAVKQADKLVRLGVLSFLDPRAVFISEQVGIGKPNPKLFLRACRALRLRPPRTVYVGDHPARDIDPAASIGMIAVRSRRGGKYGDAIGSRQPDHEISDFYELARVLSDFYGVRRLRLRRRTRQ